MTLPRKFVGSEKGLQVQIFVCFLVDLVSSSTLICVHRESVSLKQDLGWCWGAEMREWRKEVKPGAGFVPCPVEFHSLLDPASSSFFHSFSDFSLEPVRAGRRRVNLLRVLQTQALSAGAIMREGLSCDQLGDSLSHKKRNEFLIAENWKATLFTRQRENRLPKKPCQSPWLVTVFSGGGKQVRVWLRSFSWT